MCLQLLGRTDDGSMVSARKWRSVMYLYVCMSLCVLVSTLCVHICPSICACVDCCVFVCE